MNRARVLRAVKTIYVIAVVAAVVMYAGHLDLRNYPWATWLIAPGPYAFVVCWAAMAALLGLAWSRVVRHHLGLAMPASEWLPLQAMAWLGRYLPGKLGLLAGKLALLYRHSVPARALGFTVLYEQLAFVTAGAALAVCMPASVLGLGAVGAGWDGALALRLLIAVLLAVAVIPAMRLVRRVGGVASTSQSFRELWLPLWYLVAHGVAGAGLYLCLIGLPGLSGDPTLFYVIGLLAAANVAGIAAIFAPAGLGVREAVLVIGLTPWMPVEAAVITAAMLRVLSLLGDVLFCGAAIALGRALRRGQPV